MIETVNNDGSLSAFKKLSQLQKLILSELYGSENHSLTFSNLSNIIAKKTDNILKKEINFEKRKKELIHAFKEEYDMLPEDKKPISLKLLQLDLKLLYNNLRDNKKKLKINTIKDSFRASFSRTITRLENRNLIKTYNYYIPDYYPINTLKENYSKDEGYKVLYRKFVELTLLGLSLSSKLNRIKLP